MAIQVLGSLAAIAALGLLIRERREGRPRLKLDVLPRDPLEDLTLSGFKQMAWARTKGQTYLRVHVTNVSRNPNTVLGAFLLVSDGIRPMDGPSNVVLEQGERTAFIAPWGRVVELGARELEVRASKGEPTCARIPLR